MASPSSSSGAFLDKVALFQNRFELTIAEHQSKQNPFPRAKEQSQVQVHIRQRPINAKEQKDLAKFQVCFANCNESVLYYPSFQILTEPSMDVHSFAFDGNHGPETDQDSFYSSACADLWNTVQKGGIFALFAYGQTGSGKTHTVMGVCNKLVEELPFDTNIVSIQLLEVIGDVVKCLKTQKQLRVMVDPRGNPVIQGDSEIITVASTTQAKAAIEFGFQSRKTAGTLKNDTSSRSHFICMIKIQDKITKQISEVKLVDLAGSERNSDSKNHSAERIKESVYINKSLMALKSCIRQKSSILKTDERIPYRSSKLTLLLKDVLDPSHGKPVKLVMVATLSPTVSDVAHSLDTFRYAAAMKCLPSTNSGADAPTVNPMKWSKLELNQWLESHSKGLVSLKSILLNDLNPTFPDKFIPPAWKQLYDMNEELFVHRCSNMSADDSRHLRFAYKSLFLKKRATPKSTLVTSEYPIETLLLCEVPRPKSKVETKSRAELALEKLAAKGRMARNNPQLSR